MALALVSVYLAYLCQKSMGSVVSLETHPPGARLANAAQSYVLYLRNMIWPLGLAPLYPLPKSFHPLFVTGAVILLAAITASVLYFGRMKRYLLVGWLWYLGTLVPVIGILKMGALTAMTDHYTYVSLLGIYIAIAWLLADWTASQTKVKPMVIGVAVASLIVLLPITWQQIGIWRDSETLWKYTLTVTKNNSIAHNNLGLVPRAAGRLQEALEHFEEALRIDPNFAKAHNNIGNVLKDLGRSDEAISHYEKALEINPNYADGHYNYGNALRILNRPQEAVERYREAVRIKPEFAEAHNNCGIVLQQMNRPAGSDQAFSRSP